MTVSTSIFDQGVLGAIKAYLGGDSKENVEPVHSEIYDIDADAWNKIVSGLAEIADSKNDPVRGSCYTTALGSTVLLAGATWYDAVATFAAAAADLKDVSHSAGTFTNDASEPRWFQVDASLLLSSSTASIYEIGLSINGATPTVSKIVVANLTGALSHASFSTFIQLQPAETLNLQYLRAAGAGQVTTDVGSVFSIRAV